jgi:hypothetical protein
VLRPERLDVLRHRGADVGRDRSTLEQARTRWRGRFPRDTARGRFALKSSRWAGTSAGRRNTSTRSTSPGTSATLR